MARVDRELSPDVYFSPGFYMAYWEACVLKKFSPEVIKTHNKLQKHREMRVGSIMAAANTKATNQQYFVGISEVDPPDILLMCLAQVVVSGKVGTEPRYVHIEVTRCDLLAGETLIGQVLKKNKPANEGMVIALDVYGNDKPSDYQAVLNALKKEPKIYPSQIVAVESVGRTSRILLPLGSYGVTQLYPESGSSLVNRNDTAAFFRRPTEVLGRATPARGVSTEWQDLGKYTLLAPEL
jgi:hypothetical protein